MTRRTKRRISAVLSVLVVMGFGLYGADKASAQSTLPHGVGGGCHVGTVFYVVPVWNCGVELQPGNVADIDTFIRKYGTNIKEAGAAAGATACFPIGDGVLSPICAVVGGWSASAVVNAFNTANAHHQCVKFSWQMQFPLPVVYPWTIRVSNFGSPNFWSLKLTPTGKEYWWWGHVGWCNEGNQPPGFA